jgi:hypothetical protein
MPFGVGHSVAVGLIITLSLLPSVEFFIQRLQTFLFIARFNVFFNVSYFFSTFFTFMASSNFSYLYQLFHTITSDAVFFITAHVDLNINVKLSRQFEMRN